MLEGVVTVGSISHLVKKNENAREQVTYNNLQLYMQ